MLTEAAIQTRLISRLKRVFPGCIVLKNDSQYLQGIPDLTLFYGDRWAWLEVKQFEDSPEQPNQRYYIELAKKMSYGAFVWLDNMEEIIDEIQRSFHITW